MVKFLKIIKNCRLCSFCGLLDLPWTTLAQGSHLRSNRRKHWNSYRLC